MNRDELLKVTTALKAASWANPAQYSPLDDEQLVKLAAYLIEAVDAKCAKPYETCHCGACIDPAVATCGPSPIRVKPEPVAWRLHHEGGHTQLVKSTAGLPTPLKKLPKTPLYEPEDA